MTRPESRPSASVIVVGMINAVLGGAGIVLSVFYSVGPFLFMTSDLPTSLGVFSKLLLTWSGVALALAMTLSVLMLASGYGLLKGASWARCVTVVFALASMAWSLAELAGLQLLANQTRLLDTAAREAVAALGVESWQIEWIPSMLYALLVLFVMIYREERNALAGNKGPEVPTNH
jgi:hypothetical protein